MGIKMMEGWDTTLISMVRDKEAQLRSGLMRKATRDGYGR